MAPCTGTRCITKSDKKCPKQLCRGCCARTKHECKARELLAKAKAQLDEPTDYRSDDDSDYECDQHAGDSDHEAEYDSEYEGGALVDDDHEYAFVDPSHPEPWMLEPYEEYKEHTRLRVNELFKLDGVMKRSRAESRRMRSKLRYATAEAHKLLKVNAQLLQQLARYEEAYHKRSPVLPSPSADDVVWEF